jgi:hypothetical protein
MDSGRGGEGFLVAQRRYAEAVRASPNGGVTRAGNLAGRDLVISLIGAALAEAIAPSFAHLAGSLAGASRTGATSVLLWDCTATGTPRPTVPDMADWVAAREGWRDSSHDGGRYLCEEPPASLLWLDRRESQLVGCFEDGRHLGCADRARPLQRIMSEFCRSLGIQEIHAGMVARQGRGVLIVGGGGRGKTTTSLDGLHGGLDFLGDDSVGIGEDGEGGVRGYCLYASARVRPQQLARWPRFSGHWCFPEPPEEKALFLPGTLLPERIPRIARIVAIVVPAVTGRGLHIARTSPLDAFHALVHDSRENRRFGLSATEFSRLTRMTKGVRCYRFEVDKDPVRVARALGQLIDEANP